MVKLKGKHTTNFRSIYGKTLILNMKKSNGCLEVSIKNESNALFQKKTVFIGSILCVIVLLRSSLTISTCIIATGILLILYILYELFFIIEEKLLIIKGLGCHICKKHWYGDKTLFIPYEQLQEVFINEVIYRHRVIYLLTLLTKDWAKEGNEHKLVPLFLNLLPRLDCLQIIYKNLKYLENR